MFEINDQMPFSSFKYWFKYVGPNMWDIEDTGGRPVGTYNSLHHSLMANEGAAVSEEEVTEEYEKFVNGRPEYVVYKGRSLSDAELNQDVYETMLVGVALIRAKRNGLHNPDDAIAKIMPCLEWLRKGDFFQAPASTIYHDSYAGGLCAHSLKVAENTRNIAALPNFKSHVNVADAVLVALVHDWCKIERYEPYMRNVKNEQSGKWEQVQSYKRNDAITPFGHGVASMYLANKFFKLSMQECLAIRWHMGEYNVADNEMDELHTANETYPLVMLIQFADRLAITAY